MKGTRSPGQRERGSALLIRFMVWLSLNLGRHIASVLLCPIALYFLLASRGSRHASRAFLDRVIGRPATIFHVYRHFFVFSCVLLDRLFLLANRLDHFDIKVTNLEDVVSAVTQGRGCVLLGSHLGSFEVLRVIARHSPVPVKILMYRGNARPYSQLVESIDPTLAASVIEIGTPETMLRVQESLRRGEVVGILADRAPQHDKAVVVPFLGDLAGFPTGPLILAAALGTPVVLFFGVRTGNRRYEVHFEHFANRIILDRALRADDLAKWAWRYAARLEAYARCHPFNWFNFYDFWEHHPNGIRPAKAHSAGIVADTVELQNAAGSGGGTVTPYQRVDAASGAGV
jgi:predicted LPLAT superfamily acyltransferase